METLSAAAQNELGNNALLVQGAMQSGISHGRHTAARTLSTIQIGDLPHTQGSNAIGWLQIFAQRVRDGRLSASYNIV
jgi:hypothetical protein